MTVLAATDIACCHMQLCSACFHEVCAVLVTIAHFEGALLYGCQCLCHHVHILLLLLLPMLLQVETRACFEALDDVLSVPGIDCAFLGEQPTA
jgi:hypothetical protein